MVYTPHPLPSSNSFKEIYTVKEELGKGSYATVYRCIDNRNPKSSEEYAVKVIDKSRAGESQLEDLQQEMELMQDLKHDHIVFWRECYASKNTLFIVMELVKGGDLFKVVNSMKTYSESTAAVLMKNFLYAMEYLHGKNICHRDLKPDNMLLTNPIPKNHKFDPDGNPEDMKLLTEIKVADFGFAVRAPTDELTKCCGTPYYLAPEILNCGLFKTGGPYGKQSDMWSTGVITYVLLCGYPPFQAAKRNTLFRLICEGKVEFASGTAWDSISAQGKSFIKDLLVLDPKKRLTPSAALGHPWIQGALGLSHTPMNDVQQRISDFAAKEKIKGAIWGVCAPIRLAYLLRCKSSGCKPNTALLEDLESRTDGDLKELNLNSNYIGKKGVEPLLSLIENAPQLTRLYMQGHDIENTAVERIADVLTGHPSVTHIDLSHNPISRTGAKKLINLIQVNQNIQYLQLTGTLIHQAKLDQIESLLQQNRAAAALKAAKLNPPRKAGPVPDVDSKA